MNLSLRRPILLSLILEGMMVDVVKRLPVPNVKKIRPTQGTCQVASSLEENAETYLTFLVETIPG